MFFCQSRVGPPARPCAAISIKKIVLSHKLHAWQPVKAAARFSKGLPIRKPQVFDCKTDPESRDQCEDGPDELVNSSEDEADEDQDDASESNDEEQELVGKSQQNLYPSR